MEVDVELLLTQSNHTEDCTINLCQGHPNDVPKNWQPVLTLSQGCQNGLLRE